MSAAQCVDTVPKVECTKLLLIRHKEGPCDRLTPDEKDLCAKTCMKCRGPDCKDEVKFCDTEFIPIHYNCDILSYEEKAKCPRTCRLCPDQKPEKVSMRADKNPYGWSLDNENQKAKPADEPKDSKLPVSTETELEIMVKKVEEDLEKDSEHSGDDGITYNYYEDDYFELTTTMMPGTVQSNQFDLIEHPHHYPAKTNVDSFGDISRFDSPVVQIPSPTVQKENKNFEYDYHVPVEDLDLKPPTEFPIQDEKKASIPRPRPPPLITTTQRTGHHLPGVPMNPAQPGVFVLGPAELARPLLLPLWAVIVLAVAIILMNSALCCCCFRFRMWQLRQQHLTQLRKMKKKVKQQLELERLQQEERDQQQGPPPDYNKAAKSLPDTVSYMPSVSTMPTHQPPSNWATRLLPAKVQKKREKNYEKRVLKKIQEDQISNAPRCESLPSVKEKSESKVARVESTRKNDTIVSESMVISETEPITESKIEDESNVEILTQAQTEQDDDDEKNGTLDISAKKGDTVKSTSVYGN